MKYMKWFQEALDQKQRELDEKISETMKQLDLVQKQNEVLEQANTEYEKQIGTVIFIWVNFVSQGHILFL